MKPLHPWKVSIEEAIRIQEGLKGHLILENTFSEVRTIGGADVAYSKEKGPLFGAVVVLSFPDLDILDIATSEGEISFPYIPGLLSFREGPVLIKAFEKLKIKPDVTIFEGQGIAHPRGFGLASHLGLWLDLPSMGCTKTPLFRDFRNPGPSKGSFEWVWKEGREVGAVLRTKERVKPLFVSPGHRIGLQTSVQLVLQTCRGYRTPEPLRKAHHATRNLLHGEGEQRRRG
ncbi:MAG: endonuclease V [Syntrophaceae bacterium]|nr:endonuclease V [Syntrophaceae bacterium]